MTARYCDAGALELNAACSVGISEAAIERTVAHATAARFEHLGQTLADQPVTRAHIARMRMLADQARALLEIGRAHV